MKDPLDTVAEWAEALDWDGLPSDVRIRSVDALSDTIATMIGGARTEAAAIALGYAASSAGFAGLVGRGVTAAPPMAAFGNAVAASALDFDDGHYLAGAIHPGAIVIPAALSLSTKDSRVRDMLVAQVVGYEVGLRAASLLWPKHDGDRYHTTGCAGAIGAAAAAAKFMQLDANGIARAITIAWVHAPLATFGLPMVKESIGWGAATGVTAAQLSSAGFMATPNGYRVPRHEVLPAATPFDQTGGLAVVSDIGTNFELLNTYFKKYGACRYTHAAASGLQTLMHTNGIAAADIERVRVQTHRSATFLSERFPQTIETAQYSFPFVVASVACAGGVDAPDMSVAALRNPELLALSSKVTLEHDAGLDSYYPERYPSRVTVTVQDGRTYSGLYVDAPGDSSMPLSRTDLQHKWNHLLTPVLGPTSAADVLIGLTDPEAKLLDILEPIWEIR